MIQTLHLLVKSKSSSKLALRPREGLPDLYISHFLPSWRAQGKGDHLNICFLLKPVGIMDTQRDPHLRRTPDQCPYPHCLTPPGQEPSVKAGKEGIAGKGRAADEGQGEAETFLVSSVLCLLLKRPALLVAEFRHW
ncbi:hypothetical protein ElyMa_005810800 [Elysia marginata]|uniref:Uncharacterized protein n=1 Tax=Elysia marginata TaxID=1093978 RepID=A0AAV4FUQ7_9GAST|nr:hypothetical protein ElyMa_005810800 [Elysia marginata]